MRGLLLPGVLLAARPAPARDRAAAIRELLDEDRPEEARKRCARWEAANPAADPALREACADADWSLAAARNTVEAWAEFRRTWAGTEAARVALEREAEAAWRGLDPDAPERELLALAERYAGTRVEGRLRRMAADAAVRDAATPEEAVAVARRYPDHAGLPGLVERFPGAFLHLSEGGTRVEVDPPVPLPGALAPRLRRVLRRAGGQVEDWEAAVRSLLAGWGVPDELLASLDAVPACPLPDFPPGSGPAVEGCVGAGCIVEPVDWDPSCPPAATPALVAVAGGWVVGLSLGPGHGLDLRPERALGPWAPPATRAPVRVDAAAAWVPLRGGAWMEVPLDGGPPALAERGPGEEAAPLGPELRSAGLPPGWRLVAMPGRVRVETPAGQGELPGGEVRVPPPLVRAVLGLPPPPPRRPAVEAGAEVAAALPAAVPAPLLPEGELAVALARIEGMGLARDRLAGVAGARADIDGDGDDELVIRAILDGERAWLVLDSRPAREPGALAAAGEAEPPGRPRARVQVLRAGEEAPSAPAGEAPGLVRFVAGGRTWLAWPAGDGAFDALTGDGAGGFARVRVAPGA